MVCSLRSRAERARLSLKPTAARKSGRESDRGAPSRQQSEAVAEQGRSSSGHRLRTGQISVSTNAGFPRAQSALRGREGEEGAGASSEESPELNGEPRGPRSLRMRGSQPGRGKLRSGGDSGALQT